MCGWDGVDVFLRGPVKKAWASSLSLWSYFPLTPLAPSASSPSMLPFPTPHLRAFVSPVPLRNTLDFLSWSPEPAWPTGARAPRSHNFVIKTTGR